MALTVSPYATRLTPDSLSLSVAENSPLRNPNMSRTVSINMDGLPDYGNDPEQHIDALDMDMVADFGDTMGVGVGVGVGVDMHHFGDDTKPVVDPDLQQVQQQQLHHPHQQHKPQHSADATPSSSIMPPPSSSTTIPTVVDDMFHSETGLDGGSDDDDDSPVPQQKRRRETQDVPGGFTYVDKDGGDSGRRKIRIEYITDKSRRHITFSKRKAGIMKKAYELSILTGTQVLLLVVSETGLVYTFSTTKLLPLVTKAEGKSLIQACLNAPDGIGPDGQPSGGPIAPTKGKNGGLSIRPHKLTAEASKAMLATAAQVAGATPDEAQAHATAHASAQTKAVSALGNGSPSAASRPKKRLPSKKRTASQHSINTDMGGGSAPEMIPPVPPIPDMHRQPSPSTHGMLPHGAGQPGTQPNPLQSPLSAAYHIPNEYQHPQHGMPSPTYGYPPTPTGPGGEYAAQPIPGYAYPQGAPGAPFLVHPGMYQGAPPPPGQGEPRRMMPGGDPGMRMGM